MTYLLVRLFAPVISIFTGAVNLFVRRDKTILLFGSWMGNRFTDNPRYLYQYIYEHFDEYKIHKAIWVTRNYSDYKVLCSEGYEVYMMHSLKSFYYHFKAGVHFICNISFPVKNYNGDIMGQFSGNAIKVNMLHGIGIKAGKTTGIVNIKKGIIGKIRYTLRNNRMFMSLFTPGHWNNSYHLSTSKENSRRGAIFCGIDEKWFIETGYPRDCQPVKLFPNEQIVIDCINKRKYAVLYVPTFRDCGEVPHPLSSRELREYIKNRDLLWIEKPHPAAKKQIKIDGLEKNVLYLDWHFDVNVILPEISILITDYSTVIYDAIAFDKPVLYYAPDYQHYLNEERGFLCDYKELVEGFNAETVEDLMHLIELSLFDRGFQSRLKQKIVKEKKEYLSDNKDNIADIINILNQHLGIIEKQ